MCLNSAAAVNRYHRGAELLGMLHVRRALEAMSTAWVIGQVPRLESRSVDATT